MRLLGFITILIVLSFASSAHAQTNPCPAGQQMSTLSSGPSCIPITLPNVGGTPSVGQVPTATSPTTATWQTPSGGGGGTAITSCTGDLGSCTQTGAVLAAQVVTGAHIANNTIPNAALVTAALTAASALNGANLTAGSVPNSALASGKWQQASSAIVTETLAGGLM